MPHSPAKSSAKKSRRPSWAPTDPVALAAVLQRQIDEHEDLLTILQHQALRECLERDCKRLRRWRDKALAAMGPWQDPLGLEGLDD